MIIIRYLTGFWRLFRGTNLVMLWLLFYLMRHYAVLPILEFSGMYSSISDIIYNLITFSTLMIAAGGNIINDIFDVRPDSINKPGKNIVGPLISQTGAMMLYVFITVFGLSAAWIATGRLTTSLLYFVFPASAGFLYFYSYSYKNIPVLGNFIIALLAGIAVATTVIFDPVAINDDQIRQLVAGYAIFAFLLTWIRELIKDCEDLEGDTLFRSRTLAVVAGAPAARKMAAVIAFISLAALGWVQVISRQWENMPAFVYVTLTITAPLLVLGIRILKANNRTDDKKNSLLAKIIMAAGIGSLAVFYATF